MYLISISNKRTQNRFRCLNQNLTPNLTTFGDIKVLDSIDLYLKSVINWDSRFDLYSVCKSSYGKSVINNRLE